MSKLRLYISLGRKKICLFSEFNNSYIIVIEFIAIKLIIVANRALLFSVFPINGISN